MALKRGRAAAKATKQGPSGYLSLVSVAIPPTRTTTFLSASVLPHLSRSNQSTPLWNLAPIGNARPQGRVFGRV
jgi:hypothetical protein